MPRRSPEDRAAKVKKDDGRIRRKYRPKKLIDKDRKLRLGEQDQVVSTVIVLTIAGYSPTQIGRVINISRGQVKSILADPAVAEEMVVVRENLSGAALNLLESLSIEAVQSIADVMRKSEDDKIVLQAAGDILDRAGLPKASKSERTVHQTNESRTTFDDDGITERLREAPPEVQEEFAELMERMEKMLEDHADVPDEEEINNDES